MECYNCKCKLINNIDRNNRNNTDRIYKKYKNYNLCSGCYDILLFIDFLGDPNKPYVEYEKEKVSIDLNKLIKKGKSKNKK